MPRCAGLAVLDAHLCDDPAACARPQGLSPAAGAGLADRAVVLAGCGLRLLVAFVLRAFILRVGGGDAFPLSGLVVVTHPRSSETLPRSGAERLVSLCLIVS